MSFSVEPAAKKAMIIGLTISVCNQLSGIWPLMAYANVVFKEAGATFSPNVCTIIVSLVQFGANCIAIVIVDRIDRKKLFSCSAICLSIGLVSLGLHNIYKDHLTEHTSIPLVVFSFIIFVASCGIKPLHYVIIVEIMPKKVIKQRWSNVWLWHNAKSIFRYKMSPIQFAWRWHGEWARWRCSYIQRYPKWSECTIACSSLRRPAFFFRCSLCSSFQRQEANHTRRLCERWTNEEGSQ